MKFPRTFFGNTEAEVAAMRLVLPTAPTFASYVAHGPAGAPPSRVDLYRTVRPSETGERHFCHFIRNDEGQLFTDYVEPDAQPTAVEKGKRKRKAEVTT